MTRARWLFAIAATVVTVAARAEERAGTVEVILIGGGNETGALVDTTRELLGRLGLSPNVHAVEQQGDADKIERGAAVARLLIDLRSEKETVITVEANDGAHTRTLRRDPSPTIAREELAHAIQTIALAQLDVKAAPPADAGEEPIAPPPEPTHVESAPTQPTRAESPSPAPSRSELALDLGASAGVAAFADNASLVARASGGIALVHRRGLPLLGAVDLTYAFPFDALGAQVTAHASDLGVRGSVGLELVRSRFVALDARVGGGFDVLWVEARSATLGMSALAPSSTRASPVLAASLGAAVAIAAPLVVTLRFVGDVDLGDTRHYTDRLSDQIVFSPWRFRPSLVLGFALTALGPSATGAAR